VRRRSLPNRPGDQAQRSDTSNDGFTLIELVIVIGVMPLVIGALAVGLLSVFSLQSSVSNRLTDSGDAQVVSVNFQNDVQSAALITTASSPVTAPTTPCQPAGASGYQVLGLQLGNGNLISYTATATSNPKVDNLFRNRCDSAGNVLTSAVVAHDIPNPTMTPAPPVLVTVTCTTGNPTCAVGPPPANTPAYASDWQSTVGITGVYFNTTAPGSTFKYRVVAVPAASASSTQLATPIATSTGCGFATPGTGTYVAKLCFVDFTPWNTQTSDSSVGCTSPAIGMSASIANTPYTLSFCLSVSAQWNPGSGQSGPISGQTTPSAGCGVVDRTQNENDISAVPLPTYVCPPTSEAFLGNNGFYTGVPGAPALYTVQSNSTAIVSITHIQVLNSNVAASNWSIVTGDAESTDTSENITWTSDQSLSLLQNTTNSPVGNACQSTPPTFNTTYLTGVGTTTVECSSTISEDHTGTVMLQAKTPQTLTVTLNGGGLQAMFFGVLLS